MNAAASAVVAEIPEITIAYGVSDEYRHAWPFGTQTSPENLFANAGSAVSFFTKPVLYLSAAQGMSDVPAQF